MGISRLAVFGITGRMGQSLIRALREGLYPELQLSGALASADSPSLGKDAALEGAATGIAITANVSEALKGAHVALDFSVGVAAVEHARACGHAGVPLLIGSTGLPPGARETLQGLADQIPVLIAPNTSVGLGVVAKLVRAAATALGAEFDVEILEAHHRDKRDAPSGTALALGEAIAGARGRSLSDLAVHDRQGLNAARQEGSIGYAVLRAGDIIGEHTVVFAAAGERVEVSHRVSDRQVFARGALRAAAWLIGRPAGLYGMENVLNDEIGVDSQRTHR